jgi:hypothetical protein
VSEVRRPLELPYVSITVEEKKDARGPVCVRRADSISCGLRQLGLRVSAPKFARWCSWVGSHESGPLDRLEGMYVGRAAERRPN